MCRHPRCQTMYITIIYWQNGHNYHVSVSTNRQIIVIKILYLKFVWIGHATATRSGCKPYNLYTRTQEHIDRARCIVIVVYNKHILCLYTLLTGILPMRILTFTSFTLRVVYLSARYLCINY